MVTIRTLLLFICSTNKTTATEVIALMADMRSLFCLLGVIGGPIRYIQSEAAWAQSVGIVGAQRLQVCRSKIQTGSEDDLIRSNAGLLDLIYDYLQLLQGSSMRRGGNETNEIFLLQELAR
jgi:hypothetical protein